MKQGGTRRGANMGILRVDHPDIMDFITCKEDLTQVTNFNISVAVTPKFMEAVKAGTSYDLIDPRTTARSSASSTRNMVWDKMILGAWRTGEPGVLLHRRGQSLQPRPAPRRATRRRTRAASSRCCRTTSATSARINVGYYVHDGAMDWDAFRRDIHLSTHFLDNIIDVNKYPLPEIDALSKRIRRIGLGVMGFADALVRLGIAYDTPEGVEFGRKVMEFLDVEGKKESERLANERGPFPEWAQSPSGARTRPARATRTASASVRCSCSATATSPPSRRPARSRIIAGCSSGLEPLFAVAFMRNQAGVMMPDVNEDFVAIAKREGWYCDELMERIAKDGHGRLPRSAGEVAAGVRHGERHRARVAHRMQAAFQEHCDSAIRKTTNFAHTATVEDVREIYEMAYDMKCKGVTVYRDGSRDNQVLSTGATEKAKRSARSATRAAERRTSVASSASCMGTLAEQDAEIERLKKQLYDVRGGEPPAPREARRARTSCAARRSGRRRRSARCS